MKTFSILFALLLPFSFTYAQEVHINQFGNVGIGTSTPLTKLHVNGGDISTSHFFRAINTTTNGISQMGFFENHLNLYNFDGSDIRFYTGPMQNQSFNRLTVSKFGNVGIGVEDPLFKMHVDGAIGLRYNVQLYDGNTEDYARWGFAEGQLQMTNFKQTDIEFWTSDNALFENASLVIKNHGAVGIGTDAPEDKLDVDNGHIRVSDGFGINFESSDPFPTSLKMNGPNLQLQNNVEDGGFLYYTKPNSTTTALGFSINGQGRVGIGGYSGAHMLEVGGSGQVFFGNGAFSARKGLRINGLTTTSSSEYSSLQPWDYGSNSALNLVLNASGGNVAVGTNLPEARLHVGNGNLRLDFNGLIEFQNSISAVDDTKIGKLNGDLIFSHSEVNKSINFFTTPNTSSVHLRMKITGGGDVGIGVLNPNEILEVGGDGRAFFGNGAGSNRKGILIDGLEGSSAGRIEAYDYSLGQGISLALNSFGGGNVGVGTFNPQSKLHVVNGDLRLDNDYRLLFETTSGSTKGNIWMDDANNFEVANFAGEKLYLSTSPNSQSQAFRRITIESDGDVGIGTSFPTALLSVNGSANKPGGGSWAVFSDVRSKQKIEAYESGLDIISKFNPVTFEYKESYGWGNDRHVGLIAQEVEQIAPSMVSSITVGEITDFKEVDPNEITYMLINAVKELKTENEALRKRIEVLEKTSEK